MLAHKLKINVPESHQLEIRLPDDFPSGPAEIIVLADARSKASREDARKEMLSVLAELKTVRPTEEEQKVLEDFEDFRQRHPLIFASSGSPE